MASHTVHPSALALHKQQSGDSSSREPPPYPGHLQLWQMSGYSTSYSGSEASTDMSMSSLESLSTSARQEPQGEETADISPSMVDGCFVDVASSPDMLPSSVFGSEPDLKLPLSDYTSLSSSDSSRKQITGSPSLNVQRFAQVSNAPKYSPSPAFSGNSLVRQLLQASPQYSHLLGDLAPLRGLVAAGSQPVVLSGSPKFQHGPRIAADTWNSQTTLVQKNGSGGNVTKGMSRFHASNCRSVNGYVNIGDDSVAVDAVDKKSVPVSVVSSSSTVLASAKATPTRDRLQRPSTAPADHCAQPYDASSVSTPLEQSQPDRRRSYEALDRTTSSGDVTSLSHVVVDSLASGHVVVTSGGSVCDMATSGQRTQVNCVGSQEIVQLTNTQSRVSPEQRSSPRQVDSPQQPQLHCNSPQLQDGSVRQSTLQQRQSSPQQRLKQHEENTSSTIVSCPLQSTGDALQSGSQTVCAHAAIATRATQMVERLSEENRNLRQELKTYFKKVSKLEKVERDIQKVSEAYETLSQYSQKREDLDKLMRLKLETEINSLNDINQQLRDQLEGSLSRLQKNQGYCSPESELKKDLHRKDSLITRLLAQNRDLLAAKLKLESDVAAQRSAVLENMLAKEALEKRRLMRQQSVSSDHQMTRQASAEKSDNGKMDEDFHIFKSQQCDTDDGISSDSESPTSVHSLIRQMQEKDRQIMRLEAEVVKWEEKYLEETVYRQLAVDAISIPKDAKIAALVQNSADADRLLADARLEKLAFLKELHGANERCAQLEARIKCLQADLAEKDSLIQVLQRHPSLSRASSISSLLAASCASPLNSPQQQHRSTGATVCANASGIHYNGGSPSKPSSGASSRQGSQLSSACLSTQSSSLPKNSKLVGLNSASMVPDIQSVYKKVSPMEVNSSVGEFESDQLKRCFWQV